MTAINQIMLNSTSTKYDVNDKRITTSAVTTATHFLTTNSSVSSIAPITVADLASVLINTEKNQISGEAVNLDNLKQNGKYRLASCTLTGTGVQSSELNKSNCDVIVFECSYGDVIQLISFYNTEVCYQRLFWYNTGSWFVTRMDSIPSFYKNYNDLNALATALKAIW